MWQALGKALSAVKGVKEMTSGVMDAMPGEVMGKVGEAMGMEDPEKIQTMKDLGNMANTPNLHESHMQPMQPMGSPVAQGVAYGMAPNQGAGQMQIGRQSGVQDLVARRFGGSSPMTQRMNRTQYLGRAKDGLVARVGGAPGIDNQKVSLDASPGEMVVVIPENEQQRARNLNAESGVYNAPLRPGQGTQIPGTDILQPPTQRATGTDKFFAGLGVLTSRFQGKPYGERLAGSEDFRTNRALRDEIYRFQNQLASEGRAPTYKEMSIINNMQRRIGQRPMYPSVGTESDLQVGINPVTGQPRVQTMVRGTGGMEPVGDPRATGAPRNPVIRQIGVDVDGDGVADQMQPEIMDFETGEFSPFGAPKAIERGIGAAQELALEGEGMTAVDAARTLTSLLESFTERSESGELIKFSGLEQEARTAFNIAERIVLNANLAALDPEQRRIVREARDLYREVVALKGKQQIVPDSSSDDPEEEASKNVRGAGMSGLTAAQRRGR